MYKDKFVLSVIHDGSPVKETGRRGKKEVAIPFGSEYKIRLKNKNDRSCTARVFIDGKKVSQLGDFIITAGNTIDLERFVDSSLLSGKRFKFVSLDHEDVDDPTSSDNGIVKVEFRLAKEMNGIKILPPNPWPALPDDEWQTDPKPRRWQGDDGSNGWKFWYTDDSTSGGFHDNSISTVYYSNHSSDQSLGKSRTVSKCKSVSYAAPVCSVMDVSVAAGATIEGGNSGQSFTYSDLEVDESHVVTLKLKMVGINKERSMNRYKYCTNCGNRVRRTDKYCSSCGHRRRQST